MCRREEPPRYESGLRAHGSNQGFHRLLSHAVARALTTAPGLTDLSPAAVRILIPQGWRRKGPPAWERKSFAAVWWRGCWAGVGALGSLGRELFSGVCLVESVELATVWLVDLVGSTRLATSVGPVRADELHDEYFGLLREAIAASGGREFKNTGDGLFVAFSSASAAVGCAVLTQQLFERRYRGAEQQLHVRIGLGTGEATVRDGDYFGMPSIEAARLCGQAPVDGIRVSLMTRMAAGRVEGARFESVGELELKGIPEPVEAFSVAWEPLDPERAGAEVGRWPLPEALRGVPRVAYVGREVERGLLELARSEARSGARRVVLLSGEPGIGKTRLASYAALGANADGFAVCWGACSEDLAAPGASPAPAPGPRASRPDHRSSTRRR